MRAPGSRANYASVRVETLAALPTEVESSSRIESVPRSADFSALLSDVHELAAFLTDGASMLKNFASAAAQAQRVGLGVHAGHDLSLANLPEFCTIHGLLEVSIGHALIGDALQLGLAQAVRAYVDVLRGSAPV
jgi:pyridoxine 5-phosphate synthase